MTDLDAQASLVTEIQQACRKAKESKRTEDLEAARLMMNGERYEALEPAVRENLRWAYAAALMSVTGALQG